MSPENYGLTLEQACAWDGTESPLGSFGYTIASVCECSCVIVLDAQIQMQTTMIH